MWRTLISIQCVQIWRTHQPIYCKIRDTDHPPWRSILLLLERRWWEGGNYGQCETWSNSARSRPVQCRTASNQRASLQKDDTYMLRALVDLDDITNAAIATMGAKGWKSTEIMEVSDKRWLVIVYIVLGSNSPLFQRKFYVTDEYISPTPSGCKKA